MWRLSINSSSRRTLGPKPIELFKTLTLTRLPEAPRLIQITAPRGDHSLKMLARFPLFHLFKNRCSLIQFVV